MAALHEGAQDQDAALRFRTGARSTFLVVVCIIYEVVNRHLNKVMKRSFLGLALVVALLAQVHTSLIFFHWLNAETATVLTLQLMLSIGIRFRLAMANMELVSGADESNDQDRVALQAVVNAVEGQRAFRVMLVILSAIVPIALYTVGFALDWTNRPATDRAIWLSIVSYGSNIISVVCMEVLMALAGTLVKGHGHKLGNKRVS